MLSRGRDQRILLDQQRLAGRRTPQKIERRFELPQLAFCFSCCAIADIKKCGAVHHAATFSR